MNSMSTIDESIQQLHDTTIRHQTAINTIQATLAVQQKDIADIKTTLVNNANSINLIINSLSNLAMKLGLQITLPPPLPLFMTPPTPPLVAAASSRSPSFPLDATSPHSAPPAPTITPPTSPYAIGSNKAATIGNNPSTLLSNLARHSSFAEIESTTNGFYEVLFLGVGDLEKNSRVMFYKVLGARPAMNPTWLNEQKWTDARNMFVLLLGKNEKTIFDKALFVFDPGGKFNFESILDLEDKIDFEGMLMI